MIQLASREGFSHRVVRSIVEIFNVEDKKGLREELVSIVSELEDYYDGEKNSSEIQKLKGMIREFEGKSWCGQTME
ncbi:hypothetical protein Ct9H90mP29_02970 [bacterium]|nr:MAG: hypothetical protein Ct9H90mP29_02970 [bacterium]